jgi:hypothetical protein
MRRVAFMKRRLSVLPAPQITPEKINDYLR